MKVYGCQSSDMQLWRSKFDVGKNRAWLLSSKNGVGIETPQMVSVTSIGDMFDNIVDKTFNNKEFMSFAKERARPWTLPMYNRPNNARQ